MMNTKRYAPPRLVAAVVLTATFSSASSAQEPKYKADVPSSLITPDKVQTELLGELEFTDGMPSEATVKKTWSAPLLKRVE